MSEKEMKADYEDVPEDAEDWEGELDKISLSAPPNAFRNGDRNKFTLYQAMSSSLVSILIFVSSVVESKIWRQLHVCFCNLFVKDSVNTRIWDTWEVDPFQMQQFLKVFQRIDEDKNGFISGIF